MKITEVVDKNLLQKIDKELYELIETSQNKEDLIKKLVNKIINSNFSLKTTDEIIDILKIPKRTFITLLKNEDIPHIHINNKTRLFNVNEVYNSLNSQFKVS